MEQRRVRPALQRTETPSSTVKPPAEDMAAALLSPSAGEPLRDDTRAYLEPRLGHSLSNVRVHADGRADALARSVQAEVFTTGSDIYVRSGSYDPDSRCGLKLLAHEATHTLQQSSGPVAGTQGPDGVAVSSPDDPFEQAASATADHVGSDYAPSASGPAVQGSFEAPPPDGLGMCRQPPVRLLTI